MDCSGRYGPSERLISMAWEQARLNDLAAIFKIAAKVHPDYPEEWSVFFDRLSVFQKGCFIYRDGGQALAYLISHPWQLYSPPALNRMIGRLPRPSDTYYIHDLALLPEARGQGITRPLVETLVKTAQQHGLNNLSLTAVNGSTSFWNQYGFRSVNCNEPLQRKLESYGEDVCYMVRELR